MKNDELQIRKIIAFNIKTLRMWNDLSIRKLSKLSGLDERHLRRIEKCENTAIIPTLIKIADVFDIDYVELLINLHDPEDSL